MRAAAAASGLLLCLGALAGCDQPFPDETLVERLRILAVAAEPPEVGLEGSLTFEALVADPAGQGRPRELTWGVCFFELGYAAADVDCPGPSSFPLAGAGDRATLSVPALIAWLLEQELPVDPGDPGGGGELPARVTLFVGLRVEAPALPGQAAPERVRALKRFDLRLQGAGATNRNPALAGVSLDGAPWDDAVPPRLEAGSEHLLRPTPLAGSVETYTAGEPPEERQETLLFSWFSTGGEFRDQRSVLDPWLFEDLSKNRFKAPAEPGGHTLWVVVRDERHGVGWWRGEFEVVDEAR